MPTRRFWFSWSFSIINGRPYSSKARVPTELILPLRFSSNTRSNETQKIRCSQINNTNSYFFHTTQFTQNTTNVNINNVFIYGRGSIYDNQLEVISIWIFNRTIFWGQSPVENRHQWLPHLSEQNKGVHRPRPDLEVYL